MWPYTYNTILISTVADRGFGVKEKQRWEKIKSAFHIWLKQQRVVLTWFSPKGIWAFGNTAQRTLVYS